MRYFIHKDILIKSYFSRKVIQVWKLVSDSNSADYIILCSKTPLDCITYKINSEFFILTFQGLPFLVPNFLLSLFPPTGSLHASRSVILAVPQIVFTVLAYTLSCYYHGSPSCPNDTQILRYLKSSCLPTTFPDSWNASLLKRLNFFQLWTIFKLLLLL